MELPSPERWQRIEALFDAAMDLPAEQRQAFLSEHSEDDETLRAEVARMLEAAEGSDPHLDTPAIAWAGELRERAGSDAGPAPLPVIERYRLIREFGRGGMGTVYLAERADFRQRVALKLIRPGLHLDERLVLRFREEREILASLEHPHIARLLDGGVTADGLPYFVMELVEGARIDEFCDAGRLAIPQRLALFRQVCDAVQYAHDRGIVHRDLKPSNVLVTPDGRAKLLDFGIAKLLARDEETDETLTRTGQRPMTPEYASPEQVRAEAVSPASDVYALGVMLYELLTGRPPYRVSSRSRHAIERAVLEQDPIRPSVAVRRSWPTSQPSNPDSSPEAVALTRSTIRERLPRQLRGDLDAIALKALEKDPGRRYATAGALGEDLDRYLDQRPVVAQPSTAWYRGGKLLRRHPLAAALGGVIVVLLLVGGAGAAWLMRKPLQGSSRTPVLAIGGVTDHRPDTVAGSVSALTDMLATNLGRADGVRVVAMSRLFELLGGEPAGDGAAADAARRAGATELVEGVLYTLGNGELRLDLRRIDLARGDLVSAYRVEGPELFALADQATAELVTGLGVSAPPGSVAEVTTRSAVAYRLYADGLREYFVGQRSVAQRFFGAALAEDSTFALAAYYHALSTTEDLAERARRLERAVALADRAPDRERLLIRAAAADLSNAPALRALAETLVVRFPAAVDGHFYLGLAQQAAGQFAEAVPAFQRVIELDSLGTHVGFTECAACLAYIQLVSSHLHTDDFPAALAVSAEGIRRFPRDRRVWGARARALGHAGRFTEAIHAFETAAALDVPRNDLPGDLAWVWLLAEEYDRADSLLRVQLGMGDPDRRDRARNFLLLSLRAQGRMNEALTVAREKRAIGTAREGATVRGGVTPEALMEAVILGEAGRHRAARALFDSIARWRPPTPDPAAELGNRTWTLGQSATALAAAGDTTPLPAIIQELERSRGATLSGEHQVLPSYVRALLLAARGDDDTAIATLRSIYHDPALGYTRINAELARLYLRSDRPLEAVSVVQAALRGAFGALNSYVGRTEWHHLLGQAWDAAGRRDSALVHYRRAARGWQRADPEFADRVRWLHTRIGALGAGTR